MLESKQGPNRLNIRQTGFTRVISRILHLFFAGNLLLFVMGIFQERCIIFAKRCTSYPKDATFSPVNNDILAFFNHLLPGDFKNNYWSGNYNLSSLFLSWRGCMNFSITVVGLFEWISPLLSFFSEFFICLFVVLFFPWYFCYHCPCIGIHFFQWISQELARSLIMHQYSSHVLHKSEIITLIVLILLH